MRLGKLVSVGEAADGAPAAPAAEPALVCEEPAPPAASGAATPDEPSLAGH